MLVDRGSMLNVYQTKALRASADSKFAMDVRMVWCACGKSDQCCGKAITDKKKLWATLQKKHLHVQIHRFRADPQLKNRACLAQSCARQARS